MEHSHYYTANPKTPHEVREFDWPLRGRNYHFATDAGVFAKTRIDYGSELLIDAIEVRTDDIVLDMGCGYGPIGIVAAALAKDGKVYMVDVNERAAEMSQVNLAKNNINNAEVRVGDGFEPVNDLRFTLILINPPIRAGKEKVYSLLDDAYEHLALQGRLYVVVRTKQGAKSMERKIESLFGNVREIEKGGGYRVILAVK